MADIYITGNELIELSRQTDLPMEVEYHEGHLILTGSYRLVIQTQFKLDLVFQKMSGTHLVFEIVDSNPSFGILDSIIKSSVFHWIQKSSFIPSEAQEMLSIDYPFITIDLSGLPGFKGMFDYLSVDGVDFEEAGIRVRFHLLTLPQAAPA